MKKTSFFLSQLILGFGFILLFNACNFFSKVGNGKAANNIEDNPTTKVETSLNIDSSIVKQAEPEANFKDFIEDAAIMANIKSFHSINSSIICEIVLYVIPNEIEKDIPIDFLITNNSFTELYFDTTLFLNNNHEGVIYNQERNFYEINLGRKKIGKNFIAKIELPHLTENNSIEILPNQFETIFMNR